MDQPGVVANPARGKLNRGFLFYFPVPVCAWKFGLARQVRPSRPASACSFSTLRLNLVLTRGVTPDFRSGVHLFFLHTPSGQSRFYRVTQLLTDGVHCRESAGTGLVAVVPVMGAAFAGHHEPISVRLSFPTPTIGMKWAC